VEIEMLKAGTTSPPPAELIARARAMIPVLAERAAKAEAERRVSEETIAAWRAAAALGSGTVPAQGRDK
jgi:hypothetical protein